MENGYRIFEVEAEMFECNSHFPDTIAFKLKWTASIGFGELCFTYNTKKNEWDYDSEHMSRKFCEAVLNKWLSDIMPER